MEADKRGMTVDELLAERAKLNPAGRFGDPEEFGLACAFLCGAKAGFITGQNILLDGGAFPGTLMKAVWYERTGAAPDVLTYGEMPTPVAGPAKSGCGWKPPASIPPMSAAAAAAIARWNIRG